MVLVHMVLPGHCQLNGGWWWMLGLLEESPEDETHQEHENMQAKPGGSVTRRDQQGGEKCVMCS